MSDDDTIYCSFVSIDYIICECGETFPSEDDLRVHLEKEHPHAKRERKEYKCGVCDQIYPTSQECVDHFEHTHIDIKLEHNYGVDPDTLDEDNEEDLQCETNVVQETYKVKTEPLGNELNGCYGDSNVSDVLEVLKVGRKSKVWNRKTRTVCEICGKKYASNAALTYHQRVHTGERPYKCTMCSKTFTMPLFLKIHERTHTGERPYQCPHCPKAFSNKAALLRHDRVHTGIKPYACPKCGKTFTQSNSMKLHVNTVHLKMPAPYKSQKRRLKERMRQGFIIDNANESVKRNVKEAHVTGDYVYGSVEEELTNGSVQEEFVNENVGEMYITGTVEEGFMNASVKVECVDVNVEEECEEGNLEEECVKGSLVGNYGGESFDEKCMKGSVKEELIVMEESPGDIQEINDTTLYVVQNDGVELTQSDVTYFYKGDDGVTYTLVYN